MHHERPTYRASAILAAAALGAIATGAASMPAPGGGCIEPKNEDCDGAIPILFDELPAEINMPLGCINDIADKPYFDVFFQYDCTVTGEYTLDMCDSPGDMHLRIYINGCGFSDGDEFAVADDECPGSPPNADPQITVTLEAGTSYWFELGSWRPDPPWAPPPNSIYTFRFSFEDDSCPADLDGSGTVGPADLAVLLGNWGACPACAADLSGDGAVDPADLAILLGNWGPC